MKGKIYCQNKGYELGEEFDTIHSKVTMLKDEAEMLVDDVWEEEMLEFKKYGVIPGTYTDKGDDVEKLLENARTELNILRERKAAGKQSFDNLETDVTYNEEGRNDLKILKVYRLLRKDQWDYILSGLQPNNPESCGSRLLNGSNNDDTPFISVTKRYEVALFFASKAYHERGERDLRIAVIKLDASKEGLLDVSDAIIRRDHGFETKSTEDNFANCFEEVLLQRNIEPDEIIGVRVVNTKLPWCQTFRDFRFRYVDISVAYPSSNVISYLLPFFEKWDGF
eukprot:scaffold157059_cov56-Cyclotella_meneghiniana.AAC.4